MVEAQQPAARVDRHADRVEPQRRGTRALAAAARADRRRRRRRSRARWRGPSRSSGPAAAGRWRGRPRDGASRLDLDEHERGAVAGHDVDLAAARAHVARDDRKAATVQVLRREALAEVSDRGRRRSLRCHAPRYVRPGSPWRGTALLFPVPDDQQGG